MLRATLAGLLGLVMVMGPSLGAVADPTPAPEAGEPDCVKSLMTGKCLLSVTDEDSWPPVVDDGTPGSKTVKKAGCQYKGETIPCRTSEGFWDPASGCYLTPQDKPSTFGDTSKIPPGSKFYRCWVLLDVVDGKPIGEARFESEIKEPGEPQTIDPRVAAQQVVESMTFVAPQLGLSPYVQSSTHVGIVNVPIWMWVTDPGEHTTGPLTEQATLGGVTIEATGTVDRIEWSMGTGDVITCKGPGTPFTRAAAEGKSLKQIPDSPTCGYKYRKTSRCEKDQKFQVTATTYWNVHWTGGGMQGDIPLQFSRSLPLQVTDLRPVLVDPEGGTTPHSAPARTCP